MSDESLSLKLDEATSMMNLLNDSLTYVHEERKLDESKKDKEKAVIEDEDVKPLLTSDEKERYSNTGKSFIGGGIALFGDFLKKVDKEKQLKGIKLKDITKEAKKITKPKAKKTNWLPFVLLGIAIIAANFKKFGESIEAFIKDKLDLNIKETISKSLASFSLDKIMGIFSTLKDSFIDMFLNLPAELPVLFGRVLFGDNSSENNKDGVIGSIKRQFTDPEKGLFGMVGKLFMASLEWFSNFIGKILGKDKEKVKAEKDQNEAKAKAAKVSQNDNDRSREILKVQDQMRAEKEAAAKSGTGYEEIEEPKPFDPGEYNKNNKIYLNYASREHHGWYKSGVIRYAIEQLMREGKITYDIPNRGEMYVADSAENYHAEFTANRMPPNLIKLVKDRAKWNFEQDCLNKANRGEKTDIEWTNKSVIGITRRMDKLQGYSALWDIASAFETNTNGGVFSPEDVKHYIQASKQIDPRVEAVLEKRVKEFQANGGILTGAEMQKLLLQSMKDVNGGTIDDQMALITGNNVAHLNTEKYEAEQAENKSKELQKRNEPDLKVGFTGLHGICENKKKEFEAMKQDFIDNGIQPFKDIITKIKSISLGVFDKFKENTNVTAETSSTEKVTIKDDKGKQEGINKTMNTLIEKTNETKKLVTKANEELEKIYSKISDREITVLPKEEQPVPVGVPVEERSSSNANSNKSQRDAAAAASSDD